MRAEIKILLVRVCAALTLAVIINIPLVFFLQKVQAPTWSGVLSFYLLFVVAYFFLSTLNSNDNRNKPGFS